MTNSSKDRLYLSSQSPRVKIAVIATGYVSIASDLCFSNSSHNAVCVDKFTKKSSCSDVAKYRFTNQLLIPL